jgi:hypothetical protein
MKRRNGKCRCLVEPLEPRSLLSGYSATEVTWIPEGSSGLVPLQITSGGLFTVENGDLPNQSYYASTVSHRQAYILPSTFGLVQVEPNGTLIGTNLQNYQPELDTDGVVTALPNPTGVSALTGNDDYGPGFIVASINDSGKIVGLIEGNDPGIVTQFYTVPVEYDPVTNQSTAMAVIGELDFPASICVNNSGLIAYSDVGFALGHPYVYNPNTGTTTTINAGSDSVIAIN